MATIGFNHLWPIPTWGCSWIFGTAGDEAKLMGKPAIIAGIVVYTKVSVPMFKCEWFIQEMNIHKSQLFWNYCGFYGCSNPSFCNQFRACQIWEKLPPTRGTPSFTMDSDLMRSSSQKPQMQQSVVEAIGTLILCQTLLGARNWQEKADLLRCIITYSHWDDEDDDDIAFGG